MVRWTKDAETLERCGEKKLLFAVAKSGRFTRYSFQVFFSRSEVQLWAAFFVSKPGLHKSAPFRVNSHRVVNLLSNQQFKRIDTEIELISIA